MNLLKLLLKLALAVVIAAGVVLVILYSFLNPNHLKPMMIAEVKSHTGYNLVIDKKMAWTLFPRIAITVPHMTLTADNAVIPFADMSDVRFETDLNKLIHREGLLESHIVIDRVRVDNITVTDIDTDVTWQNNELHVTPLHASLYDGTVSGNVIGHDIRTNPKWEVTLTSTNVNIKSLMADVLPRNKLVIDAKGSLSLQLAMQGRGRQALLSSLNGDVLFNTGVGSIRGFDLNYLVSSADAIINKQPIPSATNLGQTDFNSFNGSAVIKNGIAQLGQIQLVSPAFMATGDGMVDLLSGHLNIDLNAKPVAQLKTQWGVIVRITGDVNHPVIKLDADQMTKYTIKQQIDKAKDKARAAVQKHVPGKVGDYLQHLLSR